MVLYSKFTYGSQFSEENNGSEIRFLVPEILNKYERLIFLDALYHIYQPFGGFSSLENIQVFHKPFKGDVDDNIW